MQHCNALKKFQAVFETTRKKIPNFELFFVYGKSDYYIQMQSTNYTTNILAAS